MYFCFEMQNFDPKLFFIFSVLVARLDEKELEMKKEYSVLHDRYTEVRWFVNDLWMIFEFFPC